MKRANLLSLSSAAKSISGYFFLKSTSWRPSSFLCSSSLSRAFFSLASRSRRLRASSAFLFFRRCSSSRRRFSSSLSSSRSSLPPSSSTEVSSSVSSSDSSSVSSSSSMSSKRSLKYSEILESTFSFFFHTY